MRGMDFNPTTGQLSFFYDDRIVATTDGTLICLLPDLVSFSALSVQFPDPALKDYAYSFRWVQTRQFVPGEGEDAYRQTNNGQVIFTRRPEELLTSSNLIAVPDGADIFVGQVKINRTVNPSHTWFNNPLQVLPKQNEWIPLTGSLLMEQGIGIARALHIYPEDGFLKMEIQQSVGPAVGGYGQTGVFSRGATSRSAREVVFNVGPGMAAWTSSEVPYRKTDFRDNETDSQLGPSLFTPIRRGESNQVSLVDPTNYRTLYSVDVRGYFGRRS